MQQDLVPSIIMKSKVTLKIYTRNFWIKGDYYATHNYFKGTKKYKICLQHTTKCLGDYY